MGLMRDLFGASKKRKKKTRKKSAWIHDSHHRLKGRAKKRARGLREGGFATRVMVNPNHTYDVFKKRR